MQTMSLKYYVLDYRFTKFNKQREQLSITKILSFNIILEFNIKEI